MEFFLEQDKERGLNKNFIREQEKERKRMIENRGSSEISEEVGWLSALGRRQSVRELVLVNMLRIPFASSAETKAAMCCDYKRGSSS